MNLHSSNQRIDELMHEARNEKPLLPLTEVESIIGTSSISPAVTVKGLHVGLNSLIVITGIVVSSFLAYMALKVDNVHVQTPVATVIPDVSTQTASDIVNTKVQLPAKNIIASVTTVTPKLKREDFVRPKQNPENLTASTNTVVTRDENVESEPASIAVPSKKKILSGQFMITFYYNDQKVEMKVAGDDIAELAVDQKVIPETSYSDYDDVIAEGRNYLMGDHSKEVNTLQLISFFDSQLHSDKILNGDSHYAFELSSSELLINKTSQSYDVFRKYKKLYESKTGKEITEGSTYRYEKGN
jgi:hypothetical protein